MDAPSLNHQYRLVWNEALAAYVAVAETTRGRGKGGRRGRIAAMVLGAALHAGLLGAALAAPPSASQLPTGGNVVAGQATVSTSGARMDITQTTQKAAIEWQSFNIGGSAHVNFNQPAGGATLNRVLGSDASAIYGKLSATGQVFLVNPNGVLFAPGAQVDVGGLVASTLDLRTADFMAGQYKFAGASSNAIVNQGNITATRGGTIALIAAKISNEGALIADRGNVLLGAGGKVTLDMGGPVKLQVDNDQLDTLIENGGAIRAAGGTVWLTAQAANTLAASVINHRGVIEAQSLATGEKGEVVLFAHGGSTEVSGRIDATGGFVETSGARVKVADTARITAGRWLIDPHDFTIAAQGGDISGAALSNALSAGDVTIQTGADNAACFGTQPGACGAGNAAGNGDIFVNDGITWGSGSTLTLNAYRNVEVNAPLDAGGGAGGKLMLQYGQGGAAANNAATYTINAPIALQNGQNFSTRLGSDGMVVDYTVINSAAALQAINGNTSGAYALGADIDLHGITWTAIGDSTNRFTGRVDGLGHTVSNLSINRATSSNHHGLFGYADGAQISNINLNQVTVSAGRFLGSLVGQANASQVYNVSARNVLITGERGVGGLVGYMTGGGTVAHSNASGETRGNGVIDIAYHGGLVGLVESFGGGTIQRSYASVDVAANSGARVSGGLVGLFRGNGIIEDSYATGNVWGRASTGTNGSGGLVGRLGDTGDTNAQILRSYATGAVAVKDGTPSPVLGGLIGYRVPGTVVASSFWDIDTSGLATSAGGTGIHSAVGTVDAYTKATYSGFDFNATWWLAEGATRPFLRNEWRPDIRNAHQLQLMAIKPAMSYVLAQDIDLAPSLTRPGELWAGALSGGTFQGNWAPIGYNWDEAIFSGSLDGRNRTISNLFLSLGDTSGAANLGLFGLVENGVIQNLKLLGGSVAYTGGGGRAIGALVGGLGYGSIVSNVTSNIPVEGHIAVGGLVGRAFGDSEGDVRVVIRGSKSTGAVLARNATAGGLVGEANYFSISDSGAEGEVVAQYYLGGLVGLATDGNISRSYAKGTVTSTDEGDEIGGLVGGTQNVLIESSYASGPVYGAYLTGGLVGRASSNTQIVDSYATGAVTAADYAGAVGGLVGALDGSTVNRSYATGQVSAGNNAEKLGGLVGDATSSSIAQAYSTGQVSVGTDAAGVGGLVGQATASTLAGTYSTGNVGAGVGARGIGGLVGVLDADSALSNSYTVSPVSVGSGAGDVGALVGASAGAITSSFYNSEVNGGALAGAGTGKTGAQLQDIATYAGWDIVDDPSVGAPYARLLMGGGSPVWQIKSVPAHDGPDSGGGGNSTGGGTAADKVTQDAAVAAAQAAAVPSAPVPDSMTPAFWPGTFAAAGSPGGDVPGAAGSLLFVDLPAAADAGPATATSAVTEQAGRDPSGFMRVFVVAGGINVSASGAAAPLSLPGHAGSASEAGSDDPAQP